MKMFLYSTGEIYKNLIHRSTPIKNKKSRLSDSSTRILSVFFVVPTIIVRRQTPFYNHDVKNLSTFFCLYLIASNFSSAVGTSSTA